jgi:hypothetical protein
MGCSFSITNMLLINTYSVTVTIMTRFFDHLAPKNSAPRDARSRNLLNQSRMSFKPSLYGMRGLTLRNGKPRGMRLEGRHSGKHYE